jgi:hypothetical protein
VADLLLVLILVSAIGGAVIYGVCWVAYWATVGAMWLAHRGALLIERTVRRIRHVTDWRDPEEADCD